MGNIPVRPVGFEAPRKRIREMRRTLQRGSSDTEQLGAEIDAIIDYLDEVIPDLYARVGFSPNNSHDKEEK